MLQPVFRQSRPRAVGDAGEDFTGALNTVPSDSEGSDDEGTKDADLVDDSSSLLPPEPSKLRPPPLEASAEEYQLVSAVDLSAPAALIHSSTGNDAFSSRERRASRVHQQTLRGIQRPTGASQELHDALERAVWVVVGTPASAWLESRVERLLTSIPAAHRAMAVELCLRDDGSAVYRPQQSSALCERAGMPRRRGRGDVRSRPPQVSRYHLARRLRIRSNGMSVIPWPGLSLTTSVTSSGRKCRVHAQTSSQPLSRTLVGFSTCQQRCLIVAPRLPARRILTYSDLFATKMGSMVRSRGCCSRKTRRSSTRNTSFVANTL